MGEKEKWEKNLRNLPEVARESIENSNLRQEIPAVPVSDSGNQYYCEKKVNLQHKLGEIETRQKRD